MENKNFTQPCHTDESKGQVIVLNTCKGLMAFSPQQIIRIQAIGSYSKLFFSNGKTLVVAKVLHWFQEQSCFYSFVRIHRSHLVNVNYIQSCNSIKSGFLYLHNNEMFPVAKRKKAALAKQLNGINILNKELTVKGQFNNKKTLAA